MGKIYVLDTNVLVHDYNALDNLTSKEAVIYIPYTVLEELDGLKTRQDETGKNARKAIRMIEELEGGKLHLCDPHVSSWAVTNDDKILCAALELNKKYISPSNKVILVTKDIALRLKAKKRYIHTQDYHSDRVNASDLYDGLTEGYPNEPKIVDGKIVDFMSIPVADVHPSGLEPANLEQQIAIYHCLNKEIPLVSLVGRAGSGKTLVALASALEAIERGNYDRLTIARPIMPFQKDIGFLPGEVENKIFPWFAPILDNLDFLYNYSPQPKEKAVARREPHEDLMQLGILEFCPLTYIRGRSLARQIIILDECQNTTPSELRTILTRVGERSKIILTGDYTQIDSPYLSSDTNGLVYCVEKFKDSSLSAHITLTECKRSRLAQSAADRL